MILCIPCSRKEISVTHSHLPADEKPWKGRPWWMQTLKSCPLKTLGNFTQRGQLPLKRSVSTERYVETLVVADKMMVGYHGRRDIEQYILAIMNIVSVYNQDIIPHSTLQQRLEIPQGPCSPLALSFELQKLLLLTVP